MTTLAVVPVEKQLDKVPLLCQDLGNLAEQADKSALVASVMRIVNINPHIYPLASCGLRAGTAAVQNMIDAVEDVLELMMALNDEDEDDWGVLTVNLQEFFGDIELGEPEFLPVLEYAIGRILMFGSLFGRDKQLTPSFKFLMEKHINALKEQQKETRYLGELLANWLERSTSPLIREALPEYLQVLSAVEVKSFRNQISKAWICAYIASEEYETDHCEKLLPILSEAAKLVGVPEFLRTFILQDLDDAPSYLEAVWTLFELHQIDDAQKIANECLEKFGQEVATDVIDVFVQPKDKSGDYEGAANEYVRIMQTSPSPLIVRFFMDYVDVHFEGSKKESLLDRGQEIIESKIAAAPEDSRASLSTELARYCMRRGKVQEAFASLNGGCEPYLLGKLLKADAGSKHSFAEMLPLVKQTVNAVLSKDKRALNSVEELLLLLYKSADSTAEKAQLKAFAKELRDKFDLKGKSAQILRRFGI